jgi:hypothetical protein
VNYSALALRNPEAEEFSARPPGAPDTVRCATGHGPVRQTRESSGMLLALYFEPNFGLFNC